MSKTKILYATLNLLTSSFFLELMDFNYFRWIFMAAAESMSVNARMRQLAG